MDQERVLVCNPRYMPSSGIRRAEMNAVPYMNPLRKKALQMIEPIDNSIRAMHPKKIAHSVGNKVRKGFGLDRFRIPGG